MALSRLTRRHALRIGVAGAAALAFVPGSLTPARAAFDAFIWFDDGVTIAGPRPDKSIEVDSFSWGPSRNALNIGSATSGAGSGKMTTSPFIITKKTDSASPSLYQACVSGKHFSTVRIVQGPKTVVLHDVIISSFQKSSGGDRPTETLTLSYAKYELTGGDQTAPMMHMDIVPVSAPTKKPTP